MIASSKRAGVLFNSAMHDSTLQDLIFEPLSKAYS